MWEMATALGWHGVAPLGCLTGGAGLWPTVGASRQSFDVWPCSASCAEAPLYSLLPHICQTTPPHLPKGSGPLSAGRSQQAHLQVC
jgi:hypothetical protein